MIVSELMSKKIVIVEQGNNLNHASRKMRENNIGVLPVMDKEKLLGVVTDRDITCFVSDMNINPASTMIEKVMTTNVSTCYEDDDIQQAAKIMQDRHIRRLVVIDHDHNPVGLLSVDDLARGSHELAGAVLEMADTIH